MLAHESSKKLKAYLRLMEELMLAMCINSDLFDHALGAKKMSVNELRDELEDI